MRTATSYTFTMDILETVDTIFEKLKKIGGENNEQLPSLEKYVEEEMSALLDAEAPIRENFEKVFNFMTFEGTMGLQLSGSAAEGAMMARLFQESKDLELEVDAMKNMFTIPQEVSHLLEPVKDKIGFVRLPFCHELCSGSGFDYYYVKDFGGGKNDPYISPLVIKDTCKYMSEVVRGNQFTNYLFDFFPDRVKPGTGSCKHGDTFSKTETTMAIKIKIPSKSFCSSTDFVPAVHLLFWPHQATTWITRYRVWPPQDTIQSIVDKGCQVVPRSSPDGDVHSEWRLSFSGPEAILAKLRSKQQ